ncbi:hypothetical protein WJX82_009572 [Trebouxia sp. C0006]
MLEPDSKYGTVSSGRSQSVVRWRKQRRWLGAMCEATAYRALRGSAKLNNRQECASTRTSSLGPAHRDPT